MLLHHKQVHHSSFPTYSGEGETASHWGTRSYFCTQETFDPATFLPGCGIIGSSLPREGGWPMQMREKSMICQTEAPALPHSSFVAPYYRQEHRSVAPTYHKYGSCMAEEGVVPQTGELEDEAKFNERSSTPFCPEYHLANSARRMSDPFAFDAVAITESMIPEAFDPILKEDLNTGLHNTPHAALNLGNQQPLARNTMAPPEQQCHQKVFPAEYSHFVPAHSNFAANASHHPPLWEAPGSLPAAHQVYGCARTWSHDFSATSSSTVEATDRDSHSGSSDDEYDEGGSHGDYSGTADTPVRKGRGRPKGRKDGKKRIRRTKLQLKGASELAKDSHRDPSEGWCYESAAESKLKRAADRSQRLLLRGNRQEAAAKARSSDYVAKSSMDFMCNSSNVVTDSR